ncbi:cytosolic iron-sulfur assembly component 2B [Manacus vitellinus]|uniref:cytosolic iron-sulfur assembly component 2B n=1 Tax=Manacus vitellinus TaxID=328815 RepID=UPI00115CA8FE|nr:cytosolic iron-sulfur assembly component 2B [Manacus vitellinus]
MAPRRLGTTRELTGVRGCQGYRQRKQGRAEQVPELSTIKMTVQQHTKGLGLVWGKSSRFCPQLVLVFAQVNDAESTVSVEFTPTIPHCSMATLIGLSIKVKLLRSLPERFKLDVHITPGTHASEHAVNKQLADKERVAAALENSHLLEVVNQCLSARS